MTSQTNQTGDWLSISPFRKIQNEQVLASTINREFEMISKLIVKLSNGVNALSGSINDRIDKLETTLKTKLSHKVTNMLDKRTNSEVPRMKKDSTLQSFKDEVRHDVNNLEGKVQQLSQTISPNHYPTSDKQLKIVIRGLAYHVGENLNMKVNNLIKKRETRLFLFTQWQTEK